MALNLEDDEGNNDSDIGNNIDLSKMKRRLLYLMKKFVPRIKHFSSRLCKPTSLCCTGQNSLFVLR